MDADFDESKGNRISLSLREKRWSMNSQRLEEIVKELMKPISDLRRSFDTDLCALLEEYLTEAGLHALAVEEGEESAAPNFPEVALLLQQSVSIYSRKVDCLYQDVLQISESTYESILESSAEPGVEGAEAAQSPARGAARARAAAAGQFEAIVLEPCPGSRRAAGARPPPVLPRRYVELAPRLLAECDAPAADYSGEPIGVLPDFHVCWRLQDGLLVEELSSGQSDSRPQPLSVLQLQAALPPPEPLPPPPHTPPVMSPPPFASTPLPELTDHIPIIPPVKREYKRKNQTDLAAKFQERVKITITKELMCKLKSAREFCLPESWVNSVVRSRSQLILQERRRLQASEVELAEFRGFDSTDIGGFCGWSSSEACSDSSLSDLSRLTAELAAEIPMVGSSVSRRQREESEDDGFFERSSFGDSDCGRDDTALHTTGLGVSVQTPGAVDVSSLARRVLVRLASDGRSVLPATHLLREEARHPRELSHLLLATLFLANSGNVRIHSGPPLSLDSFSLQLVSQDERLYTRAVEDEASPFLSPP